MTFCRAPYNYDADDASLQTGLSCPDVSRTQQNQKDDADINTIVRRFGLTGELPKAVVLPQYGDFTSLTDYQTALNAVMAAQEQFMVLPAYIRNRFQNDPQMLLEFCADENNREEAIKLGLIEKTDVPAAGSTEGATAGGTPAPSGAA